MRFNQAQCRVLPGGHTSPPQRCGLGQGAGNGLGGKGLGGLVGSRLGMSPPCAQVAQEASSILAGASSAVASGSRAVPVPLPSALGRPPLAWRGGLWAPRSQTQPEGLERVQSRAGGWGRGWGTSAVGSGWGSWGVSLERGG